MQSLRILAPLFVSFTGIFLACAGPAAKTENDLFQERAMVILDQVADSYRPPSMHIGDPEKYYWPKVMARFEKYGQRDSLGNAWIEALKDRSPFHFTLVGMARILYLYPESPALREHQRTILKRVFERTDSYNAWTGEGTENHTNMARCSGFLHAQKALDFPDEFPEARMRYEQMKEWILDWSRAIYAHGTGEFNSSIYQAYSVISWLNVYDFARDSEVRLAARAVLDYYAAETALHYSWGTTGGSEMRGSGARNMNTNASNYLAWLWFGTDPGSMPFVFRGNQYIQCMHALTSGYRPHASILALARKKEPIAQWYTGSKPEYLFRDPSFVKQFFFAGDGFSLGSAVHAYGGWTGSTYQTVNWRLVVRDPGTIPLEVGGNGRFIDEWSGKSTNPFTQNFQHKNTLIQLTCTPANARELYQEIIDRVEEWKTLWRRDFVQRFPPEGHVEHSVVNYISRIAGENRSFINLPAGVSTVQRGSLYAVELGDCCLGIRVIGRSEGGPPRPMEGKGNQDRLFLISGNDPGRLCGFVLEVHSQKEFSCLECFADRMQEETLLELSEADEGRIQYTSLDGDRIEMKFESSGSFMEATVDWGYGPVEPAPLLSSLDFQQPAWPSGSGWGRIPSCQVNGEVVLFNEEWPVFQGPLLRLEDGVLEIGPKGASYRVDYSERIPVFQDFSAL